MPAVSSPRARRGFIAGSAATGATALAVLAALGGIALAVQDSYTLAVPNGCALSDFRGYENWRDVAVSQTENGLNLIAANTATINAYREGVPGDRKTFPDGSKIVKIERTKKAPNRLIS